MICQDIHTYFADHLNDSKVENKKNMKTQELTFFATLSVKTGITSKDIVKC